MWERVVVRAVHPGDWVRTAGVFWVPPLVLALWLPHPSAVSDTTVLRWLGAAAGVLAIRWLMAHWYNATRRWGWHRGVELWVSGPQLESVRTLRAATVAVWLAPGAWLMGLWLQALGLLAVGGIWPWMVLVALPAAQVVLMAGTAGLYTRVVGGVSRTLHASWFEAGNSPAYGSRIGVVDPARARTVVATLVFAWVVTAAGVSIGVLVLGLTVLAHHLPAGYFGLGVAVFVGFALSAVGLLAAVATGIWTQVLARWYNRWVARGGGLRWEVERHPFSL